MKSAITKMKSTLVVFIILSLSTLLNIVEMSKGSNELSNKSVMDVIEVILNHHEYKALTSQEQLRLLIIIYNLLESHYMKRDVTTSKLSTLKSVEIE